MGYRPRQLIGQMERRMPEQGRIRLGVQTPTSNGKTRPTSIATLRFTSHDKAAIDRVAELLGGEVRKWNDEWEVITTSSEVQVVLPTDDPLGNTPIYELWSKGGLERRCDGEVCTMPRRVGNQPDDVEYDEVGCVCNAQQREECKPTTRLRVILPQLPFGGTWRLDTHSWNAAQELPGMVDAVRAVTTGGFVQAFLGIREEERVLAGKTKHFIVPYLRLDTSLLDALGGGAGLSALPAPAPPTAALAAAPEPTTEQPDPADDDEPVDAELVSEIDLLAERANALGVAPQLWVKALESVGAPATGDLSGSEAARLTTLLDKVAAGGVLVARDDGGLAVRRSA